ncbi:MAG: FAD-dependent thymidylate synthase [Candidatus Omnitrophica bacterium]|nr:FAD-dependent thymidylate synthase [Candidatus Omnitrophota bacterium]
MGQVKLNVQLLESTTDAISVIYAACRQCYSQQFAGDIFNNNISLADKTAFVRKVVASGHDSPLEHVKFTFAVEGVSRALTHQLVRHRMASYSQQSQRYVQESNFEYIVPPSIETDSELKAEFIQTMRDIQLSYNKLLSRFKQKGKTGEQANQDARFVLPQAAETKIVLTMNCRELLHFFKHRCCIRAQWEIRALANQMLAMAQEKLPCIFKNAGAKCEELKYCPEGEKFSCGKYPLRGK